MAIFWVTIFIFLLAIIRVNIGYKALSYFLSTFLLLVAFNVVEIVNTDSTNIQGS